jgi:hypothetical protein
LENALELNDKLHGKLNLMLDLSAAATAATAATKQSQ